MRGEPRYIEALPSTMKTTSQNDGTYAPPAADGPEQAAHLGDETRKANLVVEDPTCAASTGEELRPDR